MGRLLVVFLVACATPYQSMGLRGGYDQTDLGGGRWMIRAEGNGLTRRSTVIEYTYRRARELGPAGFDVDDSDRSTTHGQDFDKSSAVLVVHCR